MATFGLYHGTGHKSIQKYKFVHFNQWQPDKIVSTSLQITLCLRMLNRSVSFRRLFIPISSLTPKQINSASLMFVCLSKHFAWAPLHMEWSPKQIFCSISVYRCFLSLSNHILVWTDQSLRCSRYIRWTALPFPAVSFQTFLLPVYQIQHIQIYAPIPDLIDKKECDITETC